MENKQAKPFLKWAGGKGQLLSTFEQMYPDELKSGKIDLYIEPFIGGGAVFLELMQKYTIGKAIISDANPELITIWKAVQLYPDLLIEKLAKLKERYLVKNEGGRKAFFFDIRDKFNRNLVEKPHKLPKEKLVIRAARLLFMNKTCFNGLMRFNARGEFNVPSGNYVKPEIFKETNILAVSKLLQNTEIRCTDFSFFTELVTANAFVYLDPPYRPVSKTAAFTAYSRGGFNDTDQVRLAKAYAQAHANGAKLMLSNSDPRENDASDLFFDDLFKDFRIERVMAKRNINSKGSKRGAVSEIVVCNY